MHYEFVLVHAADIRDYCAAVVACIFYIFMYYIDIEVLLVVYYRGWKEYDMGWLARSHLYAPPPDLLPYLKRIRKLNCWDKIKPKRIEEKLLYENQTNL